MSGMKPVFSLLLLCCLTACLGPTQTQPAAMTASRLEARLNALHDRTLAGIEALPVDSMQIPRSLDEADKLEGTPSRSWTSGFYPGVLWQMQAYRPDPTLEAGAETWTAFVEKEQWDRGTHDLGFKLYCSYGQRYAQRQDSASRAVILQASRTLSQRFHPTVGAIRSWDHHADVWQFPVIIDNMMNLEMLFAATRHSGDSSFYALAKRHAEVTLAHHFRPDYSSYHVISYDTLTGEVRKRHTHQGAGHETAWARGQAWGLYGFAMTYDETGEQAFLEQARHIARFFCEHPRLPADGIPYWDFDAPGIPGAPRDVSAATIAASALLKLHEIDAASDLPYLRWADRILRSLEQEHYQAKTLPFLLAHSTGNYPKASEVDVPIIYADYYYVEALLRRLDIANQRLASNE